MNELKPTYGIYAKMGLLAIARRLLTKPYAERFTLDIDTLTGDWLLICRVTGNTAVIAEHNLSRVECAELMGVIIPRILNDLLVSHITQFAFESWED